MRGRKAGVLATRHPSLDEVRRRYVGAILRRCKGNCSLAARTLDVSVRTIQRMIRYQQISNTRDKNVG